MKHALILALLFGALPLAALGAVIEENVTYNGWDCVVMKNNKVKVTIAPGLAGRIIQYSAEGVDWLWVNKDLAGKVYPPEQNDNIEVWKNYGGDKIWPAPQGWDRPDQWPGPGDAVLTRPYSYEIVEKEGYEVSLKLTGSDAGGHAGVQFTRTLTIRDGSNALEQHITMKNVSDKDVSWGIWTVTQVDWSDRGKGTGEHDWNEEAVLVVPMNPESRWPEKYKVMFGLASSFNWQPDYKRNLFFVRYMNFVGKIVMDVPKGWAAMVDPSSGNTFIQRFPYDPAALYPDGGNFESWVAGKGEFVHAHKRRVAPDDPKGRLIEMEVQGPKTTLKPGEETSLDMSWEVKKGGIETVVEGP